MNKLLSLIWPLLSIFGFLFVVLFDQGSGLDSPGIWLIPVGVIGIFATGVTHGFTKLMTWVAAVWGFALLSILGLYFGWFTEVFDGFIWILPAAGFTLIGIVLLFVVSYKVIKQ